MNYKNNGKEGIGPSFPTKTRLLLLMLSVIVFFDAGVGFSAEHKPAIGRRDAIFAVHFSDKNTGWIVGRRGLNCRTMDGGTSWIRGEEITDNALNDVTFIGNAGWTVGQRGTILHSTDSGESWKRQESGSEESLMSVCFLDKNRGVVVGDDSAILITDDGGISWKPSSFDAVRDLPEDLVMGGFVAVNFYDVFFLKDGRGWVAGDKGVVLFSPDGGKQWEVFLTGVTASLFSIVFEDHLKGFAVGEKGTFLRTANGGRSWETVATNTGVNLFKICTDGDHGIVVGDKGMVLQSTDGGTTWDRMKTSGRLPRWLVDVSMLGYCSSKKAAIYCGGNMTGRVYIK